MDPSIGIIVKFVKTTVHMFSIVILLRIFWGLDQFYSGKLEGASQALGYYNQNETEREKNIVYCNVIQWFLA